MATNFTKSVFASTYKDDYRDSDNYHRILFNSGRSLQARELTQMQTITQRELSRLLTHLFKDGAPVNPGGLSVNNRYEFIKLNTTVNLFPTGTSLTNLPGTTLTASNGVKVKVLEAIAASGSDPATLYVEYIDTSGGTAGATPIRVTPGTVLGGGEYTFTVQTTNTSTNPAVGAGTRLSIHGGDFFTKDRIVFASEQSIILSKYTSTANAVVGFRAEESIVTVADDPNLYDNQGATLNRSAPGADRYRIRLTLITKDQLAADENFVYLAEVRNGAILTQAVSSESYNVLEEALATRTREESGDYIVRPFTAKFSTSTTDDTLVNLTLGNGTAYVNGFRSVIDRPTAFTLSKPRTIRTLTDEAIGITFGNYVVVNTATNKGLPNLYSTVEFKNGSNFTGTTIGTGVVSAVDENIDGNVQIYFINLTMGTGYNKRQIASFGTSITDYCNTVRPLGQTIFNDVDRQIYVHSLPLFRPQSVSGVDFDYQRRVTAVVADGQITLNPGLDTNPDTKEVFTNINDWIVTSTTGAVDTSWALVSGGAGANTAVLSTSLSDGTNVEVYTFVNKANAESKQKSLVETTATIAPGADGTISLGKPDIYQVTRITLGDSDGEDISNRYIVDNGQRDTHYDLGSLKLKSGQSIPSQNVFVRYKYFNHLSGGWFFGVNSYNGQVAYEDIPSYTRKSDGRKIELRDCIDFRPVVNSSGNFGSGAIVWYQPANTSVVQATVNYYLGKTVRVVIDETGTAQAIEGEPALTPQLPPKPSKALDLFYININPYMLSDTDVVTKPIKTKRYTMKDIDDLEQRLSRLEEVTSLSLLETQTDTLVVLDSSGLPRSKSGFFVDNFVDHSRSLVIDPDYRAAIDPQNRILRPTFLSDNIRLIYDPANSYNTVLRGDNLYLDYTHVEYANQPLATETMNINPFAVVRKAGAMELSPASDNWVETEYLPENVIDGGTRVVANFNNNWSNWMWNWFGTSQTALASNAMSVASNTAAGGAVGQTLGSTGRTTTSTNGSWSTTTTSTAVARIVSDETIRTFVEDRLLDTKLLPFMRSRMVHFRAYGLRPNTRVFAFFNNVDVASWVRSEPFVFSSQDTIDYGNLHNQSMTHPNGSTTLQTDAAGSITGSFFIPSTGSMRFRTGNAEFKLLDISVPNDDDALCSARATFTSTGILEIRQESWLSTRQLGIGGSETSRSTMTMIDTGTNWGMDPLAQTFTVDAPEGIFVTKVGIKFATASATVPVLCQLRATVNGVPSATTILATKALSGTTVQADIDATPATPTVNDLVTTYFEFDEPVYLNGNTEYAIVLLTDSVDYNVYVAQTEQFLLNSTELRVSQQPTLGSLFKSQNARVWEPDQTRDLTFEIHKASFTTAGGLARLVNAELPSQLVSAGSIQTTSGDSDVIVLMPNHGMTVSDQLLIEGTPGVVGGVDSSSIVGLRTVNAFDGYGFQFKSDSAATASTIGGGNVIVEKQMMYDIGIPSIQTLIPNTTSIQYTHRTTSGRSLASGTAYQHDAGFTVLQNNEQNVYVSPRIIATARNEALSIDGNKSLQINSIMSTGNANVSPVIDLQRATFTTINNRIDNPQSLDSDKSGFNKGLNYIPETEPSGGTTLAKHITQPVGLAQNAVGLKIYMAVNRPAGSEVDMYYRTDQSDDSADGTLLTSQWEPVNPVSYIQPDDNPTIFREYEYLVGGDTGTMAAFDQYQIKIVMRSTNSSKVPVIRDLRTIALGT
jgi:hypothetical protein